MNEFGALRHCDWHSRWLRNDSSCQYHWKTIVGHLVVMRCASGRACCLFWNHVFTWIFLHSKLKSTNLRTWGSLAADLAILRQPGRSTDSPHDQVWAGRHVPSDQRPVQGPLRRGGQHQIHALAVVGRAGTQIWYVTWSEVGGLEDVSLVGLTYCKLIQIDYWLITVFIHIYSWLIIRYSWS